MRVKIGKKIYDSHKEPIMLILEESDKRNIENMLEHCVKYCSYPEGIKKNKIESFMEKGVNL